MPGTPFAGTGFGQQGLTTDTDVSTRSPAGKTRNFGWAASAPHDPTRVLLPVSVSVVNSSTHGLQNPKDPVCGYNYEVRAAFSACLSSAQALLAHRRFLSVL